MHPNDPVLDDVIHAHVPAALRDAADAFPAPAADLVDGAIARGRRKRRARTLGSAALATVTGLAVTGLVAAGTHLTGGHGVSAAAAGTTHGSAAASPGAVNQVMPPSEMETTLKHLLPPHVTVTVLDAEAGYLQLIGTDSAGPSLLEINVQYRTTYYGRLSCATRTVAPGATCSQRTSPDGALQVVVEGPSEYGGPGTEWTVDLIRPDGDRVVISEFNAASESGAVTRPTPILTVAQAEAVVGSQNWQE